MQNFILTNIKLILYEHKNSFSKKSCENVFPLKSFGKKFKYSKYFLDSKKIIMKDETVSSSPFLITH